MMRTQQRKPVPKQGMPGAVIVQYVRCGRRTCACAAGVLHGPYYYRKWREGGRQRKAYVKRTDLAAVRAACEEERHFLRLGRVARALGQQDWSRLARILKELQHND